MVMLFRKILNSVFFVGKILLMKLCLRMGERGNFVKVDTK